jgi:enamine deaminase RidA (YjgF/YER057c/UK114 family)
MAPIGPRAKGGWSMAKRQRIKGEGIPEHTPQPFPAAVKLGNMVFSSAVGGEDPKTHELPKDIEAQCRNAFGNVRRIMEKAGGSPADIGKVTVYLRSRDDRVTVNKFWVEMFPNEDDRPVRHTVATDLAGGRLIQLEFIAVV